MPRNNEDFFHGTHAELKAGDIVQPAAKSGVHNWVKDDPKAYATDDVGAAVYFANEAANNASEREQRRINGRVYRVSPVNSEDTATRRMRDVKNYSMSGEAPTEISSPSGFRVTGEVPQHELPDLGDLMYNNVMRRVNR